KFDLCHGVRSCGRAVAELWPFFVGTGLHPSCTPMYCRCSIFRNEISHLEIDNCENRKRFNDLHSLKSHTQNPPPLKACGFESHLRHQALAAASTHLSRIARALSCSLYRIALAKKPTVVPVAR